MGKVEIKDNVAIVGFYDSVGLDINEATMLQVVYLIGDKHYVLFRDDDVLSGIIFKLDMISDMYKNDKEKMYYAVSEFMSHFHDSIVEEEEYKLYEIDINNVHNLIPFDASKVLMPSDFKISNCAYNGAVVLSDGRIVVGDKDFIEKVIMDNVTDRRRRYQLLEDVYYTFCDFEKREKILNDFFYEFYENESEIEKEIWDSKRNNNYLVLYAFSLLSSLNVNFREVNDSLSIQDKKAL